MSRRKNRILAKLSKQLGPGASKAQKRRLADIINSGGEVNITGDEIIITTPDGKTKSEPRKRFERQPKSRSDRDREM